MGWSIRLFDVAGTAVRIHFTFFLLLAWIGAAHWMRGGASEAIDGVLFILILFLCVLLHEFGHVFAARRYGIKTPDVTLLPIGVWRRWSVCPRSRARKSWWRWPDRPSISSSRWR